jgi:phosphohistidine phosphatase
MSTPDDSVSSHDSRLTTHESAGFARGFQNLLSFYIFASLTDAYMARHLYLVRHAEAGAKESRQEDKSRELTQGGIKDSLHLGASFRDRQIQFDLIVASSAVRAEQTAMLIAEGMKTDHPKVVLEDVLYEASARQFLDYINNLEDGYHNVLVVGHNPVISHLAEYLTKADIGDMAPGSAVVIRFESGSWREVSEGVGVLVS